MGVRSESENKQKRPAPLNQGRGGTIPWAAGGLLNLISSETWADVASMFINRSAKEAGTLLEISAKGGVDSVIGRLMIDRP